jgi:hypothetical protein
MFLTLDERRSHGVRNTFAIPIAEREIEKRPHDSSASATGENRSMT